MILAPILFAAVLAQSPPPDLTPAFYATTSQPVEVEPGRHLNLVCLGQGAPTVMFESGAGEDSLAWRKVQARVATFTRVCAYDRAGYGLSDAARRATDADNTVDDLNRLLEQAPIAGPIVLVGHSMGGLYATHFADLHPERTAGLVLMDAVTSDGGRAFLAVRSWERFDAMIAETEVCLKAAQKADLTPATSPPGCLDFPPSEDPAFRDALLGRWAKARYIAASLSEMRNDRGDANGDSLNSRQVEQAVRDWSSLPLVVLISDPARLPPGGKTVIGEEAMRVKQEVQRRLAARSKAGVFRIATGTRHHIQDDDPQAVVDAIRDVVEAARKAPAN